MAPGLTRRRTRCAAVLAARLAVLAPAAAWAQRPGAPDGRPAPDAFGPFVRVDTLRGAATALERDGGRYRSVVGVARTGQTGPWAWLVDARGVTDAFEGFERRLAFRDEAAARLAAVRAVSPRLRLGLATAGETFVQSRVWSQTLVGTLDARLGPMPARPDGGATALRLAAGAAYDARPGARLASPGSSSPGSPSPGSPSTGTAAPGTAPRLRRDVGPTARLDLRTVRPGSTSGLDLALAADGARLGPRRRADLRATAHGRVGGDGSRTAIDGRVRVARVRRDAYQAASFLNRADLLPAEAIEATTADTLDADARLSAPLGASLRLDVEGAGAFVARRVRVRGADAGVLVFDTDALADRLDGAAALTWTPAPARRSRTEARVGLRSGAARERRLLVNAAALPPDQATQKADLLEQADFDRGDLAVEARVRHARRRLTVSADATRSIARLDTPERNTDDRDEARLAGAASADVRLRAGLSVGAEVVASDVHTVYLKAARSAESQHQRVVRLRPYLDATTDATRLRLTTEVRAAYTRDDVRLAALDPSDASAREGRLDLDLWHRLGDRTSLSATVVASDLRLGRLVPDRFAEVPTDTVRSLASEVFVASGGRWRPSVGVRVFARSDFDRAVAVRVGEGGAATTVSLPGRTRLAKVGPTMRLDVPLPSTRARAVLAGWWAWQRTWASFDGPLDPAVRTAARRGTTRFLPLVRLDTVWQW